MRLSLETDRILILPRRQHIYETVPDPGWEIGPAWLIVGEKRFDIAVTARGWTGRDPSSA